jgi:hypothetical protein
VKRSSPFSLLLLPNDNELREIVAKRLSSDIVHHDHIASLSHQPLNAFDRNLLLRRVRDESTRKRMELPATLAAAAPT